MSLPEDPSPWWAPHRHADRRGLLLARNRIQAGLRGIDAAIQTRAVDIAVSRLRHKIGDTGKPARFIQTVWGRGYTFIGRPATDDA